MIRAILFDVFGTLLDMSSLKATEQGRAELRAYGEHLKKFQQTGVYEPLTLPGSWASIPVFPDVSDGIARLLGHGYGVYTFSNGSWALTGAALRNAGVKIEAIDVRHAKGFKPAVWMYPWAAGIIGHAPSDCMMVSANKDFGDLEGAAACGMQAQLIRGQECPDLLALAEKLGV